MNLGHLVAKAVKKYGNKAAIVFNGKSYSYHEVYERVNRLANGLLNLGVKKGDRVLFLGYNSSQYIEGDFAMAKCGIIRVPLRSRLSTSELLHIMNDSQANTLILEESFIEQVNTVRKEIKYVKNYIALSGSHEGMLNYEELISNSSSDEPHIDVCDDDVYALIYTTGTTGRPKGAMQTHRNLLWVTRSILLDVCRVEEGDILLSFLPLSHAPIIFILPFFINGAKHIILPRFRADDVLETIARERVSTVFMVPTVIYMLLENPELKKYDLSSLKTILYGGSPMVTNRLIEAMDHLGSVFVQAYGLAEGFMPITMLTKDAHAKAVASGNLKILSSAGGESTFQELKIVDESGKNVGLNEPGEIIIRGDNVMKGYWNNPEATHEAIKNAWFHTGDIGTMDEEGYVYIIDRKHEMIITGGMNVYPREVEELLFKHPAVLEAVAIGVPHDKWGESIKAIIVLKEGIDADEEEIISFCKGKIADYKVPKSVGFVKSLPKGGSEKILRKEVKEKYWKGLERKVH
jgi:acyl-CoA synthetase (AMP-forming)/AMP-acid ligase II